MIVEAEPLPPVVRPGFATALDLHARAGAGDPAARASCTATLRWPGGAHRWHFEGEVPAGRQVRIGTIQFEVPVDAAGGELVLEVTLGGATHRQSARIVPS